MSNGITRRELLGLALASPLAAALSSVGLARGAKTKGLDRNAVINSPAKVGGVGDAAGAAQVKLVGEWSGPVCGAAGVNRGRAGGALKEVGLVASSHRRPPE